MTSGTASLRPDTLRIESREAVLWLTKVNADAGYGISLDMITALEAVLDHVAHDSTVRAVVIDAEGDALQNGAVMVTELRTDMTELTREDSQQVVETGHRLGRSIARLPVPVIGIARGGAAGGGLELLLRSDFVYCLHTAQFSLPEVTFGFVPGWGGTQWAARLMPFRRAQEMLLLGKPLDGRQAEECGLVTKAFPDPATLDAHVEQTLLQLRGCSPTGYQWIKRCLAAAWDGPLAHGERQELIAETETMASGDFIRALRAYSDGRQMDYWAEDATRDE
jgi:enoyl-CoA hydratase/carnithine racemase